MPRDARDPRRCGGSAVARGTEAIELWLPSGPTTLELHLRLNTEKPPLATAAFEADGTRSEVTLRVQ